MVGRWDISWLHSILGLVVIVLTAVGCGQHSAPMVSLRSSPTPIPSPTATPTMSPSPTATVTPTTTPTPPPSPTPQPPVAMVVTVVPEALSQGQTAEVRVTLDRAASVSADFDGQPLTFVYDTPTDLWALIPVAPWTAVGERSLLLEAMSPEGQTTRAHVTVPVVERPFTIQNIQVPADQTDLLVTGLRPAEDRYLASFLEAVSPEPLWDAPFLLPAEGIRTSPFGARRSYQGGPPVGYHGGLDIAAAEGTPVFAAANGRVVLAEPLFVRGNLVVIDHGVGVYTLYFHLSELGVAPGQMVTRGEQVGLMGTTGLSTGTHLHWEVRVGETFVDPDEWLTRLIGVTPPAAQ